MSSIAAVILCAGRSERMGGIKKEYQLLDSSKNEFTVLGNVINAFSNVSLIDTIVVVVPENDETSARNAIPSKFFSSEKQKLFFVNGGNKRQLSVFNALLFLNQKAPDYVLIHDGARPWISPDLIIQIIDAVKKKDAVIPLLPINDTPKELLSDNRQIIGRHLNRTQIGLAQTPQAFKFPEILRAHEKAASLTDEEFTDDAQVWGRFCCDVAVIPGDPKNKKITNPEDLN